MASNVAAPLERYLGHISGVTQMTSSSTYGNTSIVLQFDLNRDINAAARDVQAAINAARSQLPADLPASRLSQSESADAPILLLSLTSTNVSPLRFTTQADSILAQKLAQVEGVGQVFTWGSSRPAVRVSINPDQINSYGSASNKYAPRSAAPTPISPKVRSLTTIAPSPSRIRIQLFKAYEYDPLIVAGHVGAPVRTERHRHRQPIPSKIFAISAFLRRAERHPGRFSPAGANMIETVDRIKALMRSSALPSLLRSISASHGSHHDDSRFYSRRRNHASDLHLARDSRRLRFSVTSGPRSSQHRCPLSLIGTFGVMYLCGYSLDNLSLMALTISTGFVVDDAIVVIENIARHIEGRHENPRRHMKGASEIGFTVLSMSSSLVAVFIPILLFPGSLAASFANLRSRSPSPLPFPWSSRLPPRP